MTFEQELANYLAGVETERQKTKIDLDLIRCLAELEKIKAIPLVVIHPVLKSRVESLIARLTGPGHWL